ncbi:hypothetical protein CEXT_569811 [Caerostris extrusa]|uniref:Uncharacterized protein n=1 Tax=Caerostris extrusa TaxID=172846 RepID=A0AAV4VUJ5_CAEEX|nr:hypothetical protein CEXT_569811 [Caerostris extrusa]
MAILKTAHTFPHAEKGWRSNVKDEQSIMQGEAAPITAAIFLQRFFANDMKCSTHPEMSTHLSKFELQEENKLSSDSKTGMESEQVPRRALPFHTYLKHSRSHSEGRCPLRLARASRCSLLTAAQQKRGELP